MLAGGEVGGVGVLPAEAAAGGLGGGPHSKGPPDDVIHRQEVVAAVLLGAVPAGGVGLQSGFLKIF